MESGPEVKAEEGAIRIPGRNLSLSMPGSSYTSRFAEKVISELEMNMVG